MPDSPNLRTDADAARLAAIDGGVQELRLEQTKLGTQLEALAGVIDQIRTHVFDGNGRPTLLDRVAWLETHRAHDSRILAEMTGVLKAIAAKLDAEAKERVRVAAALANDNEANRCTRVGWLITLVGIGSGLVGALIQALAPLFFSK